MHDESYAQTPISAEAGGEGDYRVFPLTWTVEENESTGSVAVRIRFGIKAIWDTDANTWTEWPPGYFVDCWTYIIGKTGNENDTGVNQLRDAGLWTPGDFQAFTGPPPSLYCLLSVKRNEYQGNVSYRGDWISPDAAEPRARGGFSPADSGLLQKLQTRFGGKMRAMGGGAGTPPTGAPPTSAAPAPTPAAAPPPVPPAGGAVAPPVTPPVTPAAAPMPGTPPVAAPQVAAPPTAAPPPMAPPPASGAPDDPEDVEGTPF